MEYRLRLKVDRVLIELMYAGREFQVEGADTEKAREEKLLVIPAGLVKRSVLEERNDLVEDSEKWVQTGREAERYEVFSRQWDTKPHKHYTTQPTDYAGMNLYRTTTLDD